MPRKSENLLLTPVLAELGLDADVHGVDSATVTDGDLVFAVRRRVERHFLMRIEVAEFFVDVPITGGPGRIELGHRGGRRRTGVTARARPALDDLVAAARQLEDNADLQKAFLPLDSKTAVIEVGPKSSQALITHIGFSRVAMAFPPTQRYITAGEDQARSLVATLRFLSRFG